MMRNKMNNGPLKKEDINETHCKCQSAFLELRAYFKKFKLKEYEV